MFNSWLVLLFTSSLAESTVIFHQPKFIEYINYKQSDWTAGFNFKQNTTLGGVKSLTGALLDPEEPKAKRRIAPRLAEMNIPESFDAREYWKHCKSIKNIRKQGDCESCWAFAPTATISDRICIHSKGKIQVLLSTQDLLDCCPVCYGSDKNPCIAGHSVDAWEYWVKEGIVTGGDVSPRYGCKPYFPYIYLALKALGMKPASNLYCTKTCNDGTSIHLDKHYGKNTYLVANNERAIQAEIMQNGPVQTRIIAYNDFVAYKKGVYSNVVPEDEITYHVMKLLGWGVENGIPYWLCANSWGKDWGDLGGFVKIRRGVNMVGIETEIRAGMPKQ